MISSSEKRKASPDSDDEHVHKRAKFSKTESISVASCPVKTSEEVNGEEKQANDPDHASFINTNKDSAIKQSTSEMPVDAKLKSDQSQPIDKKPTSPGKKLGLTTGSSNDNATSQEALPGTPKNPERSIGIAQPSDSSPHTSSPLLDLDSEAGNDESFTTISSGANTVPSPTSLPDSCHPVVSHQVSADMSNDSQPHPNAISKDTASKHTGDEMASAIEGAKNPESVQNNCKKRSEPASEVETSTRTKAVKFFHPEARHSIISKRPGQSKGERGSSFRDPSLNAEGVIRGSSRDKKLAETAINVDEVQEAASALNFQIFNASTTIHNLLRIPKRAGIIATESPNPALEALYKEVLASDDKRYWEPVLLRLMDQSHIPSTVFFSALLSAYVMKQVVQKPVPWKTADDILKSIKEWEDSFDHVLWRHNNVGASTLAKCVYHMQTRSNNFQATTNLAADKGVGKMLAVLKEHIDKMKEATPPEELENIEEDMESGRVMCQTLRHVLYCAYELKAILDAGRDNYEAFWLSHGIQRDPEQSRSFDNYNPLKVESKYGPLGQHVYFCYFFGLQRMTCGGDFLETPKTIYKARIWQDKKMRCPLLVDFDLVGDDGSEAST